MKKSEFRELIRESIADLLLERKRPITTERALRMAKKMRASNKVDIEQLRKGMEIEQEHLGTIGRFNYLTLAKIALDHLKEIPDYYDRLGKMENEAKTANEAKGSAGNLMVRTQSIPDENRPCPSCGTLRNRIGSKATGLKWSCPKCDKDSKNEISTTASAPGFMTPKAFTGNRKKRKKK